LYDSLLDELEDDVVSNPQEVEELTEKVVDAEEADAELMWDDAEVTAIARRDSEQDGDSSGETDEVLAEQVENWSDDPVRMYLTQMGEIPLLTRAQEISLARQIETTRAQFRAKLLECEYVGQQACRITSRRSRSCSSRTRPTTGSPSPRSGGWRSDGRPGPGSAGGGSGWSG
jgi:RNA polymerase primary sigma factor